MTRASRLASRVLSTPDSDSSSRDSSCSRPRPDSPADVESWILDAPNPDHSYKALTLDDVYGYALRAHQQVWVRDADGMWHLAHITSKIPKTGPARFKDGLYYSAVWQDDERTHKPCMYSPQNGEIKPDSPHIRRLLFEEGYLWLD
ncbi:hypothetical protein HDZ31DRAFT_80937 [Schizophyllum fasciatum]